MNLSRDAIKDLTLRELDILWRLYVTMKLYIDTLCPLESYFSNTYYYSPEQGELQLNRLWHSYTCLVKPSYKYEDFIEAIDQDYNEARAVISGVQAIRCNGPLDRFDKPYIKGRQAIKRFDKYTEFIYELLSEKGKSAKITREEELRDSIGILKAGINRFYQDGMTKWSEDSILGVINNLGAIYYMEDPKTVILLEAFKGWEKEGFIRIIDSKECLFEVIRPFS